MSIADQVEVMTVGGADAELVAREVRIARFVDDHRRASQAEQRRRERHRRRGGLAMSYANPIDAILRSYAVPQASA